MSRWKRLTSVLLCLVLLTGCNIPVYVPPSPDNTKPDGYDEWEASLPAETLSLSQLTEVADYPLSEGLQLRCLGFWEDKIVYTVSMLTGEAGVFSSSERYMVRELLIYDIPTGEFTAVKGLDRMLRDPVGILGETDLYHQQAVVGGKTFYQLFFQDKRDPENPNQAHDTPLERKIFLVGINLESAQAEILQELSYIPKNTPSVCYLHKLDEETLCLWFNGEVILLSGKTGERLHSFLLQNPENLKQDPSIHQFSRGILTSAGKLYAPGFHYEGMENGFSRKALCLYDLHPQTGEVLSWMPLEALQPGENIEFKTYLPTTLLGNLAVLENRLYYEDNGVLTLGFSPLDRAFVQEMEDIGQVLYDFSSGVSLYDPEKSPYLYAAKLYIYQKELRSGENKKFEQERPWPDLRMPAIYTWDAETGAQSKLWLPTELQGTNYFEISCDENGNLLLWYYQGENTGTGNYWFGLDYPGEISYVPEEGESWREKLVKKCYYIPKETLESLIASAVPPAEAASSED